jgi:hypothetical protein
VTPLRTRALVVALTVLAVVLAQGCGIDESRNGPPFHPGNIQSPQSLLVTKNDLEGIGASTPYGAILRWWQALQQGDVRGVQRSYAGHVSASTARREIHGLQPRTAQPVTPEIDAGHSRATVDVLVRSAVRLGDLPTVVNVTDVPVTFDLMRSHPGWKLRTNAFARYHRAILDELAQQG